VESLRDLRGPQQILGNFLSGLGRLGGWFHTGAAPVPPVLRNEPS